MSRSLERTLVSEDGIQYVDPEYTPAGRLLAGLTNPARVARHLGFRYRNSRNKFHPFREDTCDVLRSVASIEEAISRGVFNRIEPTDARVDSAFLLPWLRERAMQVQPLAFPPFFALSPVKLQALYVMCRLLNPRTVVETGVANGASSAAILRALEENRQGELWSVDRPPPRRFQRSRIGDLVPPDLRRRWHLLLKDSLRGLHTVLRSVSSVDMFLHDSEHTYSRMTREFRLVWPRVASGGVLMTDDVRYNNAFLDFSRGASATPTILGDELGILRKT